MEQSQSIGRVGAAWHHHRAYLVNLAYQMLGDVGAAEDVVQEAFLRLARSDGVVIDDVRGWLTVVASRLCLDQIGSARVRYERPGDLEDRPASGRLEPADRITLDDEVRTALLEVLRRLGPGERVAFVLHDVFGIPFDAIAETVGRPPGTCRQLARRARTKIAAAQPKLSAVTPAEHQRVTEKFMTACANGDIAGLTAVLDPAVWGAGTLLAHPAPPPQVNYGPHAVATNLLRYLGPRVTLVSGPAGLSAPPGPMLLAFAERRLFAVVVLTIRDGRVSKIEAVADPGARARAPRPT